MKKSNSILNHIMLILFLVGLSFSSCTKDSSEEESTGEETDTPIALADLTAGVSIESATVIDGDSPAPNSNISFKINTANQNAFLNTGFTISFTANDNIAGAYIRLVDSEGAKSQSYFDVPKTAFIEKKPEKQSKKNKPTPQKLGQEKMYEIDVNFNSQIPVGTFCYAICVYDSASNVSQVSNVCVIVQNWGGSEDLIGSWILDHHDPADRDNSEFISCENGASFETVYAKYEKKELIFILESNGDYSNNFDEIYNVLNFDATIAQCSEVFEEDLSTSKVQYYGKWSYDADTKNLTVIDFGFNNFNDSSKNITYEEGELYFEGVTAEIIAGELIITEMRTTYNGEQIPQKSIFKRL